MEEVKAAILQHYGLSINYLETKSEMSRKQHQWSLSEYCGVLGVGLFEMIIEMVRFWRCWWVLSRASWPILLGSVPSTASKWQLLPVTSGWLLYCWASCDGWRSSSHRALYFSPRFYCRWNSRYTLSSSYTSSNFVRFLDVRESGRCWRPHSWYDAVVYRVICS